MTKSTKAKSKKATTTKKPVRAQKESISFKLDLEKNGSGVYNIVSHDGDGTPVGTITIDCNESKITLGSIFKEDPSKEKEMMEYVETNAGHYKKECDLFKATVDDLFTAWGYGEFIADPRNKDNVRKSFNKLLNGKNFSHSSDYVFCLDDGLGIRNNPTDKALRRYNSSRNDSNNGSDVVCSTIVPETTQELKPTKKETVCPLYDTRVESRFCGEQPQQPQQMPYSMLPPQFYAYYWPNGFNGR